MRLSPFGQYGGICDSNPLRLFTSIVQELNERKMAYLHLIEGRGSEIGLSDALHAETLNNARLFKPHFHGALISAGAFTPRTASDTVQEKSADAVAFGRLFIANPDLVRRFRENLPLSESTPETYYQGGPQGYVDYPTAA